MAPTEAIAADIPVALNADLSVNAHETLALARHVRLGGIGSLVVAGNANLQSMSLSQFEAIVELAETAAAAGPVTIGLGPELGRMLDQAGIVGKSALRSVLVLPIIAPADTHGTADGIRHIAHRLGHGVMVDLMRDNHLRPVTLRKLVDEGAVTAVRYRNSVANPGDDYYLERVLEIMGPACVVSDAGEGALYDHLHVRGMASTSSGIAALTPRLLRRIVGLMPTQPDAAAALMAPVLELMRIRAMLGPVQVLHDAVTEAGIAAMGPQMPMVSRVKDKYRLPFTAAIRTLLKAEAAL
ncbi:Dihydrodipicolinate synthase/N-acetylneuraminate lyase [Devosia enhydra]|uniref:Dihydrodipicolinate synthase/N-acetylneuraminate lyase n=1 Tax=Devosia enhydra TaxID=665118 RepID=A0A1K2HXV1_9HYPH|nr:hypothetical protein [Devosia enhydra]SFZ84625.1 Dihydrodipicolinate synthase/N-acetylneuraminate lyase [Devosia enhydra]